MSVRVYSSIPFGFPFARQKTRHGTGSFFGTTVPTSGTVMGNFTVGTKFFAGVSNGVVSGARLYYTGAQALMNRTAILYDAVGTVLSSAVVNSAPALGWNSFPFPPVVIAASTEYIIALYDSVGGMGYTVGLFSAGDYQGPGGAYLWAYQNGGPKGGNSVYQNGAAFPTLSAGNAYFVEPSFSF